MTAPDRPFAINKAVSFVLVSPSTVMPGQLDGSTRVPQALKRMLSTSRLIPLKKDSITMIVVQPGTRMSPNSRLTRKYSPTMKLNTAIDAPIVVTNRSGQAE